MNVQELKELLEELPDSMEVRIMQQPSWPFEYSVQGAITRMEIVDTMDDEDEDLDDNLMEEDCLFLLEGSQLCYGTKSAWDGDR